MNKTRERHRYELPTKRQPIELEFIRQKEHITEAKATVPPENWKN
jgi:hypothetical protein